MNDLTLFTNPYSRGRIAHWMLEELEVPYHTMWMQFGKPMRTPEYLALNPMGKVPVLKHGDTIITEAPAICAYLADLFPEKGLIPPAGDPARGPYYRWMFFAAGPFEMATTAKSFGWEVPEGKSGMAGFGHYDKTLNTLEQALTPGPYLCGERFTAADVYVGSGLEWGMTFGAVDKRPVFEAYVARLTSRPAYLRASKINEAYLASLSSGAA